jgi:hypothetical protein
VDSLSPSHPGVPRIAAGVQASFDAMVAAATEAIWTEVPAYPASGDDSLRDDVAAHARAVFATFLAGLGTGQLARRADFGVTREQATRRVAQGIALADFLQAFRIGQLTLWQSVLDAAGQDAAARDAALLSVAQLMQVIELGSAVAGEAYVVAQARTLAESDRIRRDLLEDLLARRTVPPIGPPIGPPTGPATGPAVGPAAGPKRALLRAAGLGPDTRLLVTAAALAGDLPAGLTLRDAAAGASPPGPAPGLAVLRQDEIVGIIPLPRGGPAAAVTGVRRACADLTRRGIRLAVGVSTAHTGLLEIPEAYAEAQIARDGLGGAPGVLALPMLSSFDYLVLREDETARRLIRPRVRRFVAEDVAAGGTLIATLTEFAACDLNAKTAAERLHLHVNTAYYRLERIAERTGCDLRRLADVTELLIAIRLLGAGLRSVLA